jgi:histidinol dehydrogenase
VLTDSLRTACEVSNAYAPEHLIVQVDQARALLPHLRAAGSIFLGHWSPESVGDYCSGTNHVLPTYGYARAYSGLSLESYLRRITVQELSVQGLQDLGSVTMRLAALEGLDAHARAVSVRLQALAP